MIVPGEQRLLTGWRNSPDLVRCVTGDVQVAGFVERQPVGQPADRVGIDLAWPERAIAGEGEPIHAIGIALDHEQPALIGREGQSVGIPEWTANYLAAAALVESQE